MVVYAMHGVAQPDITSMEYFMDIDPGVGNGTAISIAAGPSVQADFTVPTAGLSDGLHAIYFRAKDANGDWSMTDVRFFIVQPVTTLPPQPNLTEMEYFIDIDPGFGAGTSISIPAGLTVDKIESLDMSGLSAGLHFLYFRTKDANGDWGTSEARPFIIAPPAVLIAPLLVAYEFFIDTDPGIGAANRENLAAPVASVDLDIDLDVGNLAIGQHVLGIRVLDDQNNWSTTVVNLIDVCDGPNVDFNTTLLCSEQEIVFTNTSTGMVDGATYEWDFDGDGLPESTDPTEARYTFNVVGDHTVSLLVTPLSGCVGTSNQTLTINAPPVALAAISSGCEGTAIAFQNQSTGTDANSTYSWDIENDGIPDATEAQFSIDNLSANVYNARLTVTNDDGCLDSVVVDYGVYGIPALPEVEDVTIDEPGEVTLSVLNATDAAYNWYEGNSGSFDLIPNERAAILFASIDETKVFQVEAESLEGCLSELIEVEAVVLSSGEQGELTIYNIVTPYQDGKHDFFNISNIEKFSDNQVVVLDRFGSIVFDKKGYDNNVVKFEGKDADNKQLPDGNYYYQISLGNNTEPIVGYLFIKN